ncbi:hypothetical protein [Erwinia phage phiEaP8]|uniref:Uncharacterized protein n=2 Tax=Caudoviricetes TaxID=2731619 RepID=A0A3G1QTS9_9CAUD|nr:hypothetical protein HYP64_gp25 [Erwinia phage phiEaP8]AWN06267.1 hypothetical protein [Erwinia phage phiEaP8]
MSTTRLTFGAALSTVTDTLNVVSTVANVATKSVGMLDTFVTQAAKDQQIRMKLNSASKIETMIEETALADTERQKKILSFCADEQTKELYQSNEKRLRALLETN